MVKNVTVREARQKQSEGFVYIDVRSVQEFRFGHPAGAVNVPLLHHDERSGQMAPNRDFLAVMRAHFDLDAKLLIGCQVGGRSLQAAQVLASAGFTDVSNVLGGFGGARDRMTGGRIAEGWTEAGLPVDSETPERAYETLRSKVSARGSRT
jgi:rhodanese-related sulfurtransferase